VRRDATNTIHYLEWSNWVHRRRRRSGVEENTCDGVGVARQGNEVGFRSPTELIEW